MIQWILAGCTVITTLIAVTALIRLGLQRGIDRETLDKMTRERKREENERDAQRRSDDERREQSRINADEKRAVVLRGELEALSKRSNQRFEQWQEAVADLDDLWATVEDSLLPWIREAYSKLSEAGIDISRPPSIRRRHRRYTEKSERITN